MTTINISLPASMYLETKKLLARRGYASISEVIREALRGLLYPSLTANGFMPEFEDMVLESAKEPIKVSREWKSSKEIDEYFNKLKKKASAHDKDKKVR